MIEKTPRQAETWAIALGAVSMLWAVPLHAETVSTTQPRWNREAAAELLAYVERIDTHGLDPADYAPEQLRRALQAGDGGEIERQASVTFERAASDLANGHVPSAQRRRFYIPTEVLQPAQVGRLADQALVTGEVASVLDALAPQHRQYRALRASLIALPASAEAERRKIEINLERWRWMPRQLGDRYLLANIPEYRVRLIGSGREIASHRIIVGKPQTPTPQFSAQVNAIVFNPSWHVPQSIITESVGRLVRNSPATARARGYTWSYSGGTLQVTQKPGPQNALGQMKLDMPNAFTVYLHDTPNKDLFDRPERTFSHGCIRTDRPFDLAALLLSGTEWDRSLIDATVESRQTKRVELARALPVHVIYVTAYIAADGTVGYFDDPYALDENVGRLLEDRAGA